jgi:ribonucleoside-diphosphate reductase alpha chain
MTTMLASAPIMVPPTAAAPDPSGAIACSIDNPECEACQ